MVGLTVSDFATPKEYGIYLIQRAFEYWNEPHWDAEADVSEVTGSLDEALALAKALQLYSEQTD